MGANKKTSKLTIVEIWEIVEFARKFSEYGIDFEAIIKIMDANSITVK